MKSSILRRLEQNISPLIVEMIEQADQRPPLPVILGSIAVLREQIAECTDVLNRMAVLAREEGASWNDIARATDITPQAAYQRWSDKGRQKHQDYTRTRQAKIKRAVRAMEQDEAAGGMASNLS